MNKETINKLFKETDVVCLTLYSGNQIVGKFSSMNEDDIIIQTPKAIIFNKEQTKNGIGDLVGTPEIVAFREKDIFLMYRITDSGMLMAYYKMSSGIVGPGEMQMKGGSFKQ